MAYDLFVYKLIICRNCWLFIIFGSRLVGYFLTQKRVQISFESEKDRNSKTMPFSNVPMGEHCGSENVTKRENFLSAYYDSSHSHGSLALGPSEIRPAKVLDSISNDSKESSIIKVHVMRCQNEWRLLTRGSQRSSSFPCQYVASQV